MKGKVKLISLNIEGDNHLDRVMKFLKQEKPDVICLQEVFRADIDRFKTTLEMEAGYAPMMSVGKPNKVRLAPKGSYGLLILSKHPSKFSFKYYIGSQDELPVYEDGNPNSPARVLLWVDLQKGNQEFRVITTHFTWSADGQPTPLQHDHLDKMLVELDKLGEFVLCGDFNAPRGGPVFSRLARRYQDNIPLDVKTTMDFRLHRVKNLKELVVDGLFSTAGYQVDQVRVMAGLSDHQAVVGTIRRGSGD